MERKNTLLLTVIAVATLLVAVVGATFAYFASTYTQSGNDQTVNVSTRTMATVTYTTGANILAENQDLVSGAGDKVLSSGEFNIAVTADTVRSTEITFDIGVNFTSNSFVQTQAATDATRNDVECQLYSGTTSGSLTKLATVDCTGKSGKVVLTDDAEINLGTASTTFYRLDVVLFNAETVENTNVGKSLTGTIYIEGLDTAITAAM